MATLKEALENIHDTDVRHIVSISGGKDSAALAVYLKEHYPELPAEYVFCDTDCELTETYEYLECLEAFLGASITRVSVFDVLGIKRKPGRNAFDIVLEEEYGGFLPSPQARWCTRRLKIQPFEHYIGSGKAYSYIGIRADENREGYKTKKSPALSHQPNIIPVYPFKDDGIKLDGVKQILEDSGIGFPEYYEWRSRSGCYFCFYQQIGEWQGLMERHPHLFEKAKSYEKIKNGRRYTWVDGKTLEKLAKVEKRYSVLSPDDVDGCSICHL